MNLIVQISTKSTAFRFLGSLSFEKAIDAQASCHTDGQTLSHRISTFIYIEFIIHIYTVFQAIAQI